MTLSLQQYLDSDATELALIVQRGEASASELLDLTACRQLSMRIWYAACWTLAPSSWAKPIPRSWRSRG